MSNLKKFADPAAKKGLAKPPAIKTLASPTPPTPKPLGQAPAPLTSIPKLKTPGATPWAPTASDLTPNPNSEIAAPNPDATNPGIQPIGGSKADRDAYLNIYNPVANNAVKGGIKDPFLHQKIASAQQLGNSFGFDQEYGPGPYGTSAVAGKFGVANVNQINKPKLPMAPLERLKMSEEEFTKMDKFFKREEMSKTEIIKELKLVIEELKKNQ
jgi:hypothetical protein